MTYFSIIIPVYGVETYIGECIESILNQSFRDYEVILVDDGSKDRGGIICDEYASRDARLKVIHKVNGGLSEARNSGIDAATGKFIIFLDGDDYLYQESLAVLHQQLSSEDECDIYFGNLYRFYDGEVLVPEAKLHDGEGLSGAKGMDYFASFIKKGTYIWSNGAAVFSRDFLNRAGVRYVKAYVGAEDMDFYMNALIHGETFGILNSIYYCYRQRRAGSIITNPRAAFIRGQLEVRAKWYRKCSADNGQEGSIETVIQLLAQDFIKKVYRLHAYKGEELRALTAFVKANKDIIRDAKPVVKKVRGMRRLYLIFGIRGGIVLLRSYNWLREKVT